MAFLALKKNSDQLKGIYEMHQIYIYWKSVRKKLGTKQTWRHMVDLLSEASGLGSYLIENILSINTIYCPIKIFKNS